MQISTWSKKTKVITVLCTFAVMLGVLLISGAPFGPRATRAAVTPRVPKPSPHPLSPPSDSVPKPLTLWGMFPFVYSGTPLTSSCTSGGCISTTADIFGQQVVCPGEKGASCTFQITIESQSVVGSADNVNAEVGRCMFLVDGVAPIPGPVSPPPFNSYTFTAGGNNPGVWLGSSYSVTANVKNTTSWNQKHPIAVGIQCAETQSNSSGCYAMAGQSNLQVAVYTSSPEEPF